MNMPPALPPELVFDIIGYALSVHPRPVEVLSVNSTFYTIGAPVLYNTLRFGSVSQLVRFSSIKSPLPCSPRHIELTLAGGSADFSVFRQLAEVFRRCRDSRTTSQPPSDEASSDCDGLKPGAKLELESLSLCLNSHSSNPQLYQIYQALRLVNPRRFSWLGPDPSHHFSIAIVPAATLYLFGAMQEWTRAEHIKLTNIAFPSEIVQAFEPVGQTLTHPGPSFIPLLPELRTFYIGQVTRLHPWIVAAIVFTEGHENLEQVRVVDAYHVSIWGPRIRRKDVEQAALSLHPDLPPQDVKDRVKSLVKCEALTERIIGGDRVTNGVGVLE